MAAAISETVEDYSGLAPSLERRRLQLYGIQLLIDGSMLLLGFAFAAWFYLGDPFADTVWGVAQLLLPLFWTVAILNQTYSVPALVSGEYGMQRAVMALGIATLLVVLILFLARSSLQLSRVGFTLGIVSTLLLQVWARFNLQPTIRQRVGERAVNLLIIDDEGPTLSVSACYRVSARKAGLVPDLHDPQMLNRLGMLIGNMDRVIVSCPPERRAAWAMVLKGGQMRGEIVDSEVDSLGILGTTRDEGIGKLIVASGPLGLRSRLLKRALDLAIAVPALVALAIPLILIAVLIRLEDGGPALFKQPRVGRNNQFFPIYKFRTMRAAATDLAGKRSAARDDDRITRIGGFLRRTSIDEIPQLLNVLKGEMSRGAGRYLLSPVVL
jgi:polysaccharide biosynthesis protein PslA